MHRRDMLKAGVATVAVASGLGPRGAQAQQAGDPIRKLVILNRPQSNNPQA